MFREETINENMTFMVTIIKRTQYDIIATTICKIWFVHPHGLTVSTEMLL